MEVSVNGAANAILEQKQAATMQQLQVAMFKKTIDMQAQGALQLINSAVQGTAAPSSASNPPHLGNNIDTTA